MNVQFVQKYIDWFPGKKESVTGFGLEVKNDNNIFEQQGAGWFGNNS